MKNRILFLIPIVFFLFVRLSCSDLTDVSESFWIEQDFTVKSSSTNFSEDYEIDAAAQSSIIESYKDNIKSIDITEVTYELTYFAGTSTQKINTGFLKVAEPGGAMEATIAGITDQNLEILVGNEQNLSVEQAGLEAFAGLIKNSPHKAVLILEGNVNETPVDFVVKFRFKVTMVASPL